MLSVGHRTLLTSPITLAAASAVILLFLSTAEAEMYQWVDKNGVINFADNLQKVPPEYRDSAKKIDAGRGKATPRASQPSPPVSSPMPNPMPSPGMSSDMNTQIWRERLRDARSQLESIKSEREKTQKEYETFLGEYRMRTFGDPSAEAKYRNRIAELDAQISQKEEEINTTIPDEARRAGVPGGALSR